MFTTLAASSAANFLSFFAGSSGFSGSSSSGSPTASLPAAQGAKGGAGCSPGCLATSQTLQAIGGSGDSSSSSSSSYRLPDRPLEGPAINLTFSNGQYIAVLLSIASTATLSFARARRRATRAAARLKRNEGRRLWQSALGAAKAPVEVSANAGRTSPFGASDGDANAATSSSSSSDEAAKRVEEGSGTLPLTWENVDMVLDEVRPFLRNDGGDCRIVQIDGPIVRLELQGSCSDCSASSVTLKMGIEKTLVDRIPEIVEVVAVAPDQEPMSCDAVESILDGIRPFVKTSGSTIKLKEISDGQSHQKVVLEMTGPLVKSMAVKAEVMNRIRRKFPLLQDVTMVSPDHSEEEEEILR